MRKLVSTGSLGLLGLFLVALLAATLTGCGFGPAGAREKISKTTDTYLRALAGGDTAKACAQLTRRAKGRRCEATLKERLSHLEADALTRAADGSIDFEVHGNTATARLSEQKGARFVLKKVGRQWLIDSGYTIGST
jgi:hypothetical protein